MSKARKFGLGILAHIPFLGVLAVAIFDAQTTASEPLLRGQPQEAVPYLVAELVLALAQMGIAVPFILHATKNPRLGSVGKIAWPVLMVFLGSFADPIYFYRHVLPDGRLVR